MSFKSVIPFLLFIAILLSTAFVKAQADFNKLSEEFLRCIIEGSNTNEIRAELYSSSLEELHQGLNTDAKKLAFWVNFYNAYIQEFLSENPEMYEDRRAFFSREQIPIAGRLISFAKIEHGIIRKSQWEYGLGRIRKIFPDEFERTLRVSKRDYRIHFALNCGAADCPPVAIYEVERLDEQFNKGTAEYLKSSTTYDSEKNEVAVTSLFSWFRGDFGGKSGIKQILNDLELIPESKGVDINYKNYDWTLDLDNFTTL